MPSDSNSGFPCSDSTRFFSVRRGYSVECRWRLSWMWFLITLNWKEDYIHWCGITDNNCFVRDSSCHRPGNRSKYYDTKCIITVNLSVWMHLDINRVLPTVRLSKIVEIIFLIRFGSFANRRQNGLEKIGMSSTCCIGRFLHSLFNYTWRFWYMSTCIFCLKSFTWMQFCTSWRLRMRPTDGVVSKSTLTREPIRNEAINESLIRIIAIYQHVLNWCPTVISYMHGKFISFVVRRILPRISIR